jgi:hypothetical protein
MHKMNTLPINCDAVFKSRATRTVLFKLYEATAAAQAV